MIPTVQEAGCASGAVWTAQKISSLRGSDTRTVHPVANRYIDYAIQASLNCNYYPRICLQGLRKTTKHIRISGVRADI